MGQLPLSGEASWPGPAVPDFPQFARIQADWYHELVWFFAGGDFPAGGACDAGWSLTGRRCARAGRVV